MMRKRAIERLNYAMRLVSAARHLLFNSLRISQRSPNDATMRYQEIIPSFAKNKTMDQAQEHTPSRANSIFSGSEETILDNLEGLRESGTMASLGAILEHLTTGPSNLVKSKILSLVADLKIPGAAAIVANFTFACNNPTVQQELVSASWQSRLDFSPYLNRYINLAIDGEIMLVMDVLSLVEESCEKLEKEQIDTAIAAIKDSLQSFDKQKQLLMVDLVNILKEKKNPAEL